MEGEAKYHLEAKMGRRGEGHGKDTGDDGGGTQTHLKATVFEQVEAGYSYGRG